MTENSESKKKYRIIQLDIAKEIAHGICVSNLAYQVGQDLLLEREQCYELALAGVLHDIGKLELAKNIYGREREAMAIEEIKYVRTHSTLSYAVLDKKEYSPFVLNSILYHHENYDGSGYPSNLMGEDIPLGARILRVCDAFSAFIADRPYRKSFDMDAAVELMVEEAKNFDMKIFLAFLRVVHQDNIEDILVDDKFIARIEEDLL